MINALDKEKLVHDLKELALEQIDVTESNTNNGVIAAMTQQLICHRILLKILAGDYDLKENK